MHKITRLGILGLVLIFVIGMASVGAAAGDTTDATQIGSIGVTIVDEEFTIENVKVSGEALPSYEIDERTYEIDPASFQSDGVAVSLNDTTYEICSIDIRLENISVTLSDVSVGN
ncbi:hypothetical protein GWG54_19715 [Natronococcus sp. JC468]|nr:hypothetical protein [Natronococcus sp. JC468]